jgi:hypothetical protein
MLSPRMRLLRDVWSIGVRGVDEIDAKLRQAFERIRNRCPGPVGCKRSDPFNQGR